MFCTKCGKEIPDGTTQCPACGQAAGSAPVVPGNMPLQTSQPAAIQQPYVFPPAGNMPVNPKKKTGCLIGGIVGGVAAVVFVLVLILAVLGSGDDEKPDVPLDSMPPVSQADDTQRQTTTTEPETKPEQVLYEKNGIKITLKGLKMDSTFGPKLALLIENTTSTAYTVQVRDFSVNGYMVNTVFSSDVDAGKKNNDSISILSSSLEENDITKIENIEFSFHVFDSKTWDNRFDSPKIKIEF